MNVKQVALDELIPTQLYKSSLTLSDTPFKPVKHPSRVLQYPAAPAKSLYDPNPHQNNLHIEQPLSRLSTSLIAKKPNGFPDMPLSFNFETTVKMTRQRSEIRHLQRLKTRTVSKEQREDTYYETHVHTQLLDAAIKLLIVQAITQTAVM